MVPAPLYSCSIEMKTLENKDCGGEEWQKYIHSFPNGKGWNCEWYFWTVKFFTTQISVAGSVC